MVTVYDYYFCVQEAIVGSGVLDDLQRLVSQQEYPEVQCHTAGTVRNLAAEDQTHVC